MTNTCESVFKDREMKQAKVIDTPEPKWRWGLEDSLGFCLRGHHNPSVDSRSLTQHYLLSGTWKPCTFSQQLGKSIVSDAHGSAGLRCWKKRMPFCNGVDTGFNVTRRENEQTSNWSFMAREYEELF